MICTYCGMETQPLAYHEGVVDCLIVARNHLEYLKLRTQFIEGLIKTLEIGAVKQTKIIPGAEYA